MTDWVLIGVKPASRKHVNIRIVGLTSVNCEVSPRPVTETDVLTKETESGPCCGIMGVMMSRGIERNAPVRCSVTVKAVLSLSRHLLMDQLFEHCSEMLGRFC